MGDAVRGRLVEGAAHSGEAALKTWARLRRDAQQRPVMALWALPMIVFVAVSVPGGASRPALLEVLADVVERSSRSAPLVRVQGTSILESGDFVRTDAHGRALITFDDGSTILVEGSGGFAYSVRQGDLGSAVVVLAQAAGRSWYSISRILRPDSRYELRVGSAAAVVRAGAAFEALVEKDGTATITMETGSLEVSAAGATVAVESGQRTVIRPGQAPSSPSPAFSKSSSTARQSPDASPAGSPVPSPVARVEPAHSGFSAPSRPSAPPSPQPSPAAAASPTPASPLPTPTATPTSRDSSSMRDPSPSAPPPTPNSIALPTPEPAPGLPSPNPIGTPTPPPAPSILLTPTLPPVPSDLPTPTPLQSPSLPATPTAPPTPTPTPSPLAAPTPSPTESPVPTPTVLPTPTATPQPTFEPLPLPTPSIPLPTPPLSSESPASAPPAPSAPPAAIALRAVSWASVDGLGVVVAAPLGVVAGDVLIAYVGFDKGSDVTIMPPDGWTVVRRTDNGHQMGLAIYLKVAGAAEPPSYSWGFNRQTEAAVGLLAFSGVDAANPLEGEAGQETPNDTAHSTPSITTTAAGLRIVSAHGVRKSTTWTPPAGMTERFDVAASGNITLAGSDAAQAAPGATGALTAVAADQQQGLAHVLALRPAGAAGSSH